MTWWRLTEAATCYGIPERTLRQWVAEGRLTAGRKGRSVYVALEEVEQLAEWREAAGGRLRTLPSRR